MAGEARVARVEVLDVVGRHRQLTRLRRHGDLPVQAACHGDGRLKRQQLEVAEVVREDAHRGARDTVADVQYRQRGQDVVELDALGIEVGRRDDDAAAVRPRGCARAAVAEHPRLGEAVRRADHSRVVDLDEHPLEALVEVDSVLGGVEHAAHLDVTGGVVLDGGNRGDATAGADDGRCDRGARAGRVDGGVHDLRRREVIRAAPARPELADHAGDGDGVAAGDGGRRRCEDEETLGGGVVGVWARILHPEAVVTERGHDARHAGHDKVGVRGKMLTALDVVDAKARDGRRREREGVVARRGVADRILDRVGLDGDRAGVTVRELLDRIEHERRRRLGCIRHRERDRPSRAAFDRERVVGRGHGLAELDRHVRVRGHLACPAGRSSGDDGRAAAGQAARRHGIVRVLAARREVERVVVGVRRSPRPRASSRW